MWKRGYRYRPRTLHMHCAAERSVFAHSKCNVQAEVFGPRAKGGRGLAHYMVRARTNVIGQRRKKNYPIASLGTAFFFTTTFSVFVPHNIDSAVIPSN